MSLAFGRHGSAAVGPAFLFTAPAGDFASLTASTGQTGTCTRGSSGTYMTSASTLATATSNRCRVDYQGLLVEESRTNLRLQSQTYDNANWHKDGSIPPANPTITPDTTVAPDGTTTADTLNLNGLTLANQYNVIDAAATVVDTSVYTASVFFLQSGSPSTVYLIPQSGNQALAATSTWQRGSKTHTASGVSLSTEIGFDNRVAVGNTPNGSTLSVVLWGSQLELGAFPSSYIVTVGTAVTRSADQINFGAVTLSALSSMSATITLEGRPASGTATVLSTNDGTHSWTLAVTTTGAVKCSYDANSDTTTGLVTAGVSTKVACKYDGVTLSACVAGACHGSALSFAPVLPFTANYLGWDGTANYLNGFIASACEAGTSGGCPP